ncbi:MAG: sodium:calcium antiporter [Nitrospira sp.]|jgi:cation:H+ antiporter|nr:MAG: sodium:calcium antiporter [Nitrospira sp.]
MTVLYYVLLFLVSVAVTLGGCALFTNAIEWLGKRRGISEGAVGSVFAAIGTTLPETSIPIIAIFFGDSPEEAEVGLGAILGAPFMLSTLVLPILAILLLLYARAGKRTTQFHLNYREVLTDLTFFMIGYFIALGCAFVPSKLIHFIAAGVLVCLYIYYMKLKFAPADGEDGGGELEPLIFDKHAATPSYAMIGFQSFLGLGGLILGAHLFVMAAESMAGLFAMSPLILALLIAPLATELPEMSNSFLWLYRKKDRLAVANVTGAMVFQGTFPVALGLIGTEWVIASSALTTMILAVQAVGLCLLQILIGGRWRPWLLAAGAVFYIGYTVHLYVN